MSLKLLFVVPLIVACASLIACFIGWNYPLATTWRFQFSGESALGIVFATEFVWFVTNIYAILLIRASGKASADFVNKVVACIIAISFPAQVFLGHLAIRDLLTFVRNG